MRALHVLQQHAALCLTESRTLLALAGLFAFGLVSHQLRADPLPYDEAYYLAAAADQLGAPLAEATPVRVASSVEDFLAPADSSRSEEEARVAGEVSPPQTEPRAMAASAEPARMNLNVANARLLTQLPGIGPKKAAAVVAYRDEHGAFASVEDLQEVRGIGPKTVAKLAPLLFVEPSADPAPEQIAAN